MLEAFLKNFATNSQKKVICDLPRQIKYKSIHVTDVKFENQTNETIVSCGAKVYGRLTFNIQPETPPNKLHHIMIGIKNLGPQQILFSEKAIIGRRLEGFLGVDEAQKVYEPYVDYAKNFQVTMPSITGVYELEVCLLEMEAHPVSNPSALNLFFEPNSADQYILDSNNKLNMLWDKGEFNFKISMGRIQVI